MLAFLVVKFCLHGLEYSAYKEMLGLADIL